MEKKKKLDAYSLALQLAEPRRKPEEWTLERVKHDFALPVTMSGLKKEDRLAFDAAFDSAGGFDCIYQSLAEHAFSMGQYPLTSFIGYGALQQIAQQGMIRACIQTVADDCTRKWIEIKGGEDSDPDQINKLQDLVDNKYKLREVFNKAFTTCGYMGGAQIFVKTSKAEDLTLPLSISAMSAELGKSATLQFLVIDPVNVSPSNYNSINPLEADYMKPREWLVLGQRVHASRLLNIVDNEPPLLLKPNYNFFGIPQAQILWDYVLHFNKCRVSAGKLLEKLSLLVVQTDMDSVLQDNAGVQLFDAKMDFLARYRDNDSVFVCDKESEAVSNVQTTMAGATDVVRQALEMVAAINRTPAVKLLGISPSGFNATGESDITNYYDYIHSKQELHHDQLQKCIEAIQLVEFGYIDDSLGFEWVPLSEENSASKAMTAQTKVGALGQLLDRQVISAEELREAVKQDASFDLAFLDDELPDMPDEQEEFKTDFGEMEQGLNAQAENMQSGGGERSSTQDLRKADEEPNLWFWRVCVL